MKIIIFTFQHLLSQRSRILWIPDPFLITNSDVWVLFYDANLWQWLLLIKAQHTETRSSDWLSVCTERPYINKLYDDCEQQLRPRYFSTKFKADIFFHNLSVMISCQDETTFKRRKTIRVKGEFCTHLGWTNYLN